MTGSQKFDDGFAIFSAWHELLFCSWSLSLSHCPFSEIYLCKAGRGKKCILNLKSKVVPWVYSLALMQHITCATRTPATGTSDHDPWTVLGRCRANCWHCVHAVHSTIWAELFKHFIVLYCILIIITTISVLYTVCIIYLSLLMLLFLSSNTNKYYWCYL